MGPAWALWSSAAFTAYVYFAYPVIIKALSLAGGPPRKDPGLIPRVTVVIAAHNEGALIRSKLESVLSLDYPPERLQVVVASDASTDATNEIARSFAGRGVVLFEQTERRGKSAALNRVVREIASGEIVVFNDAPTEMRRDAVRRIVAWFASARVGAVAGRLLWRRSPDSPVAENFGLYWRYEEFLRRAESDLGSLPFVSGAFYALRKGLYTEVPEALPDDSVSPLGVLDKGFKVLLSDDAVAFETGALDASSEFRIKVRGVIRELGSIRHFARLLNPFRRPFVAFILWSHRLARWFVPVPLIAAFVSNMFLLDHGPYRLLLALQAAFYLLALLGLLSGSKKRILSLPFYFSLVNCAALCGVVSFLSGKRRATWAPVR